MPGVLQMWFVELDVIPDFFIRRCIRLLLKIRLISVGPTHRSGWLRMCQSLAAPCTCQGPGWKAFHPQISLRLAVCALTCLQMGGTVEQQLERKMAFVRELKCLPVAVQTAAANEQHYEVRSCTRVLA
jgi:hypothetical protein